MSGHFLFQCRGASILLQLLGSERQLSGEKACQSICPSGRQQGHQALCDFHIPASADYNSFGMLTSETLNIMHPAVFFVFPSRHTAVCACEYCRFSTVTYLNVNHSSRWRSLVVFRAVNQSGSIFACA